MLLWLKRSNPFLSRMCQQSLLQRLQQALVVSYLRLMVTLCSMCSVHKHIILYVRNCFHNLCIRRHTLMSTDFSIRLAILDLAVICHSLEGNYDILKSFQHLKHRNHRLIDPTTGQSFLLVDRLYTPTKQVVRLIQTCG